MLFGRKSTQIFKNILVNKKLEYPLNFCFITSSYNQERFVLKNLKTAGG